jgi:hypothetical protein
LHARGFVNVSKLLLKDARCDATGALHGAAQSGQTFILEMLLATGAEPAIDNNRAIHAAVRLGRIRVVDRLLCDPRVYSTVDFSSATSIVSHIGMIRGRSMQVLCALQDLALPALISLEIIDALFENEIRMWAKWQLITAVKHFHDRRGKS